MKVIKWAWRHFALTADDYDTLEEAVEAAFWASDDGAESLERIDVFEDGVLTTYDSDAVWAMDDLRKEWVYTGPPGVATIEVSNGKDWFNVDYIYEGEDREAKFAGWKKDLGEHVRLISR